jgi:hypothetical protein
MGALRGQKALQGPRRAEPSEAASSDGYLPGHEDTIGCSA